MRLTKAPMIAVLALFPAGCDSSDEPVECGTSVTVDAAHNYAFSSTLSFPPVAVQPDTEISFDWSAATSDFLDHDLDPVNDVDSVNLMLWKLTSEDLETKLNADQLAQRDLAVIATYYTENEATSARLFEFTSVGMALTPDMILPFLNATSYPPESHTYTVMLATGDELGQGTRMIQAFKLDPASTNTNVAVTGTSTDLEYTVDMHSLTPVSVPEGDPNLTISWGSLTTNALGNPFTPTDITEVWVARYTESPAELESRFLDLEASAADFYRGEVVAGTDFALSDAVNEAALPFPGINATDTWLVALICGACRNPAPWYMTVLSPCGP